MGRIRLGVLIVLLCVCLVSCGSGVKFSDYRGRELSAEVEYYVDGELYFRGAVDIGAICGDVRDISVALTAPEALRGVIISRARGEMKAYVGEREMNGEAFSAIIEGCELLAPIGEVLRIEKRNAFGGRYITAFLSTGEEIYFDTESEAPVEVRRGRERIAVKNFKVDYGK